MPVDSTMVTATAFSPGRALQAEARGLSEGGLCMSPALGLAGLAEEAPLRHTPAAGVLHGGATRTKEPDTTAGWWWGAVAWICCCLDSAKTLQCAYH